MSLAIVVVLWLSLWLPWVRIDRATFQYHVYASLPFLVIALAYLLAELWRGPGPRTWFLARLSAAVAVLGIPLLWLARQPLCRLAGDETANPNGVSCGEIERTAAISPAADRSLLVLAIGASLALWLAWRGGQGSPPPLPVGLRPRSDPRDGAAAGPRRRRSRRSAVWSATILLDREGTFSLSVSPDPRAARPGRSGPDRLARDARPGRPSARPGHPGGRDRLVRRLVSEHRRASAPVRHRARLPGRAADVELGLPVRGEPRPTGVRSAHRHDDARHRAGGARLRGRRGSDRSLVGPPSAHGRGIATQHGAAAVGPQADPSAGGG